jgi:pimeloyl-ACP methyl ester carboxylesterase/DNA-binding CsgD family transcriptional regulator
MSLKQNIRFCTSKDGVRLAVASTGSGPPLVRVFNWLTDVEKDLTSVVNRHWITELSRDYGYVRYDSRGCGFSDRDIERMSLDAWVEDLEAVIDAMQLERVPLLGISQGAAVAIAYAVRHPERVSQLVLYGGFARGLLVRDPSPQAFEWSQGLLRAAEIGWGADDANFRQVFVHRMFRDATIEQLRAFDEAQRHTISGVNAARFLKVGFDVDIRDLARQVRCPVLVAHTRDDQLAPFSEGLLLASLIPDARFVALDGSNHIPWESDPAWPQFLAELRAFLPAVPSGRPRTADAADQPRSVLTPRQLQILQAVAQGQTAKQIARTLDLSPRTVEMHVARVLAALHCSSRAEAVHKANEAGLLV